MPSLMPDAVKEFSRRVAWVNFREWRIFDFSPLCSTLAVDSGDLMEVLGNCLLSLAACSLLRFLSRAAHKLLHIVREVESVELEGVEYSSFPGWELKVFSVQLQGLAVATGAALDSRCSVYVNTGVAVVCGLVLLLGGLYWHVHKHLRSSNLNQTKFLPDPDFAKYHRLGASQGEHEGWLALLKHKHQEFQALGIRGEWTMVEESDNSGSTAAVGGAERSGNPETQGHCAGQTERGGNKRKRGVAEFASGYRALYEVYVGDRWWYAFGVLAKHLLQGLILGAIIGTANWVLVLLLNLLDLCCMVWARPMVDAWDMITEAHAMLFRLVLLIGAGVYLEGASNDVTFGGLFFLTTIAGLVPTYANTVVVEFPLLFYSCYAKLGGGEAKSKQNVLSDSDEIGGENLKKHEDEPHKNPGEEAVYVTQSPDRKDGGGLFFHSEIENNLHHLPRLDPDSLSELSSPPHDDYDSLSELPLPPRDNTSPQGTSSSSGHARGRDEEGGRQGQRKKGREKADTELVLGRRNARRATKRADAMSRDVPSPFEPSVPSSEPLQPPVSTSSNPVPLLHDGSYRAVRDCSGRGEARDSGRSLRIPLEGGTGGDGPGGGNEGEGRGGRRNPEDSLDQMGRERAREATSDERVSDQDHREWERGSLAARRPQPTGPDTHTPGSALPPKPLSHGRDRDSEPSARIRDGRPKSDRREKSHTDVPHTRPASEPRDLNREDTQQKRPTSTADGRPHLEQHDPSKTDSPGKQGVTEGRGKSRDVLESRPQLERHEQPFREKGAGRTQPRSQQADAGNPRSRRDRVDVAKKPDLRESGGRSKPRDTLDQRDHGEGDTNEEDSYSQMRTDSEKNRNWTSNKPGRSEKRKGERKQPGRPPVDRSVVQSAPQKQKGVLQREDRGDRRPLSETAQVDVATMQHDEAESTKHGGQRGGDD